MRIRALIDSDDGYTALPRAARWRMRRGTKALLFLLAVASLGTLAYVIIAA